MQDQILRKMLLPSPIAEITDPIIAAKGISLFVKREDLIHPWLSGNKYRKLKYNIIHAKESGFKGILTFGGAFSNHIYAVAGAGALFGLKTIGIIRGEIDEKNPTIIFCRERGMQLFSVSRQAYKLKEASEEIHRIVQFFPDYFLVPEGGSNDLALQGVNEMVSELYAQMPKAPDVIALACGTGGTTAGILSHSNLESDVLAFSSLKSQHLQHEIISMANGSNKEKLKVVTDYHFGGYGDWSSSLLDFIDQFEAHHQIPVDHVYNGKAVFGLIDLIRSNAFKAGTMICYIHTGGLQGKEGLKYRIEKGK